MPVFRRIKSMARTTTTRLALSYLAIIMAMSIGFGVAFFFTSDRALHRQEPPPERSTSSSESIDPDDRLRLRDPIVEAYLRQRAAEGRHELLIRLIGLNAVALVLGGGLSYYLARRTLRPIEVNMEAQAQFVSDASHELRTPLTVLQTTNEVALRKPKLSETDARDLLEHNVAEVAKLQALTDGLLRLARPDKKLIRTPVSLQTIASEAMNGLIPAAQSRHIRIEDNTPDINVFGDPAALTQALSVLLDNAIKYSPQGSTITLTGARSSRLSEVSVIDHGPGISPNDLPHIFDRFYRADQSRSHSENTTADGYGIGLSLAKKIVHQMDGEIIASSTPGKGSTFTIKLPAA